MAESPNFRPGHRYSVLGVEMEVTSRLVRWGLPTAAGLIAVLGLWILS